ncbi:MAG: hypothetical protein WD696_08440 [Bryobacteraceae bacterium]
MPVEPPFSQGPVAVEASAPAYRWYHKAFALAFIVFCLESGLFLLLFPWSEYWDLNYFASVAPEWRDFWGNAYLRGAVSGLGMLNLYVSLSEIFRLRRFSRTP